ncbi:sulfurtransferase [Stutzerimonas balearica]|uniref:sulfurtransferase n=1 Tax=Stutzerimonas balearica TaxID=74829 RepID=UPI0022AEFA13|nr:sulfurtransferase [Stutzerimonas balearica]MCZ4128123.1 sulfurtransferase [Stutzerimonas balearica]
MSLARLITAQQLAGSLPQSLLIDCRFALEDPSHGQRSYLEGHLPGARFLDLERDLSGPVEPGVTGRHPLPEPQRLIRRLREIGVDNDSRIVLYDDGPGAFAARAWWLLAWLGKRDDVYLLDGGLAAWRQADQPLEAHECPAECGTFTGQPDPQMLIEATELSRQLADFQLLDARAQPRFRGDVEPLDPVAGHIPGAICAPFSENLGGDGRFLAPDQLRQRFLSISDGDVRPLVAYCGSGVTACHNLFAMSLAGLGLPRLYAGSWSEWITDPARPVARGDS